MSASGSAGRRIPIASVAQLHKALWQGDQLATPALPACPSGFDALDANCPAVAGRPPGLTDLLLREPGSGEIHLLAPALARLAGTGAASWCGSLRPTRLTHRPWQASTCRSTPGLGAAPPQPTPPGPPSRCCARRRRGGAVVEQPQRRRPRCAACTWQPQEGCTPLFAFRPLASASAVLARTAAPGASSRRRRLPARATCSSAVGPALADAAVARRWLAGTAAAPLPTSRSAPRCCGSPCTCRGCRLRRWRVAHGRRATAQPLRAA